MINPVKGLALSSLLTTGLMSAAIAPSVLATPHTSTRDYHLTSSSTADLLQPLSFAADPTTSGAGSDATDGLSNIMKSLWMLTFGTPIDWIEAEMTAHEWDAAGAAYQTEADAAYTAFHAIHVLPKNPLNLTDDLNSAENVFSNMGHSGDDFSYFTAFSTAAAVDDAMGADESTYASSILSGYFTEFENLFTSIGDLFGSTTAPDFPSMPETINNLDVDYGSLGTAHITNADLSVSQLLALGPEWAGKWVPDPSQTWQPPSGLTLSPSMQNALDGFSLGESELNKFFSGVTNIIDDGINGVGKVVDDLGNDGVKVFDDGVKALGKTVDSLGHALGLSVTDVDDDIQPDASDLGNAAIPDFDL